MSIRKVALVSVAALALSGCAAQVVGSLTLSQVSSIAGFAATLVTGRDLGEHALSLITGQDCRFLESLLREDRDICEDYGSPATAEDFQGVFVALGMGDPFSSDDALDRMAKARAVELASAEVATDVPVEVTPATATTLASALPQGKPVGLVQLGGTLVYMMAPIYDSEPVMLAGVPRAKPEPSFVAVAMPKAKPEPAPAMATPEPKPEFLRVAMVVPRPKAEPEPVAIPRPKAGR